MKRIILCADDYGQNSAISQAIVELLKAKRLSATSCLVTAPLWLEHGKLLAPFKDQADIGLHLNLTEGKPIAGALSGFFSLKQLLIKANLGQLDKAAIATEFRAQLDRFVEVHSELPAFFDGHQHIHQFPVIRDVVIDLFNTTLRSHGGYVRCTYNPKTLYRVQDVAYLKQLFIQLSGGIAFRDKIDKDSIPHNNSFAGVYNFNTHHEYEEYFPRFLQQVDDGGIVMCHPGMMGMTEDHDEINEARHNEYIYFSGAQFTKTCQAHSIRLVRFKDLPKKA